MNPSMQPAAEANRLKALHLYHVLDSPAEECFDELTRLAAHICSAPVAIITFVDADRLWIKSRIGCELSHFSRGEGLWDHVLQTEGVFAVENCSTDQRFINQPF